MTMTKFYTIEEAAKISGKSTRTIRRHLDKLDTETATNVIKKDKNKILLTADFVDSLTRQKKTVTTKNVTVKNTDDDDLKRQISRLEKKLDEKESEIKQHITDIKLFTSKVLSLESEKGKIQIESKAELEKKEAEKNELLIQKTRLEEQLANEKTRLEEQLSTEQSKSKTAYLIAGLLFVFVLILFLLISLQVF